MANLICPVSTRTIDKHASRVSATLTAGLLVGYSVARLWPVLVVVVIDYAVRVCTRYPSPLGLAGRAIARLARLSPKRTNAGPKIFAWRVGALMAAASILVLPFSLPASIVIAAALAAFNLLDGVGNFCVGCAIYTHVVLPLNKAALTSPPNELAS